jgi:hypothetical protein
VVAMHCALSSLLFCVGELIAQPGAGELVLFDFESPADVKAWAPIDANPKTQEPPARGELSSAHATRGKQSLKITFAGGRWPTIGTTQVPEDWLAFKTFKADVTVDRPCVVGFTILQEKSQRGGGWDATVSRWTKTEFLKPGVNTIAAPLRGANDYSLNPRFGKVTRFEIFMYEPHDGESIYVDNIRLSSEVLPVEKKITQFKVAGTDLVVSGENAGVRELGKLLKDRWKRPDDKSVDQIEDEFRGLYGQIRLKIPGVAFALFREGDKEYDPAHPDKVYSGWKDAYWSSHGPDGMTVERSSNMGKSPSHELFMRHRSPLMKVDLSSIPPGSQILTAIFLVVRAGESKSKQHSYEQPNMWVVEPCNRPWNEYEVNGYEYAKGKFWKAIGGMHYGDDPDFSPVYLAHGPSQAKVGVWNFAYAVRYWVEQGHANHGFMLHGDAGDWFVRAHSREAANVRDRPAVMVIYLPK